MQQACEIASLVLADVSSWIGDVQDALMHWALPQGNFVRLRDKYGRWGRESGVGKSGVSRLCRPAAPGMMQGEIRCQSFMPPCGTRNDENEVGLW